MFLICSFSVYYVKVYRKVVDYLDTMHWDYNTSVRMSFRPTYVHVRRVLVDTIISIYSVKYVHVYG